MICPREPPRVLAVGSHPDDIELGAGGFIFRLVTELSAEVHFLVLTHGLQRPCAGGTYLKSDRAEEAISAAQILGIERNHVEVLGYEDCRLGQCQHELIRELERRLFDASGNRRFDLVLTHAKGDRHDDHRQCYAATISATRSFDGAVLLYEAPSTIPNEFRPTLFVALSEEALRQKFEAICAHVSQREKPQLSRDRILGIAASWAWFYGLPNQHFEAFEVSRFFWELPPIGADPRTGRVSAARKPNQLSRTKELC